MDSFNNTNVNSKFIDDNSSYKNNCHSYKNYSINEWDFPKNFVPIIKPKDVIFGNEENIIPFSLDFPYNGNDKYINDYSFNYKNNKEFLCKVESKKKLNPILDKLIKKRQLSNNFF